MPHSQLLQLVENAEYDAFETRCMEYLEAGTLQLPQLVAPFQRLQKAGQGGRVATVAAMVLESAGDTAEPRGALAIARLALESDPNNADLRKSVVDLFTRVYGEMPGFAAILANSGLASGRPARGAMRVLDACVTLNPGDTLISRTENRVVEVLEVDRERGLFTLKHGSRPTTMPATEVVREYEPIDANDFRALRAVAPEKLRDRVQAEPVAIISDILRAHGDGLDADSLKRELVPHFLTDAEWPKWWTRAKTLLKRCPNVVVEGRAPVYMRYTAAGQSLESEAWQAFEAETEPVKQFAAVDAYLREKARWKEPPDAALLQRYSDALTAEANSARARRPAAALAYALVLDKLGEQGVPMNESARSLAVELLRDTTQPVRLVSELKHDSLWERAVALLSKARPDSWIQVGVDLFPVAPAALLDTLASAAREAGRAAEVQKHIEAAVDNPVDAPEIMYWLWRGPKATAGYVIPPADILFSRIIDTLAGMSRTLTGGDAKAKEFRAQMKAALALKDYGQVREVLKRMEHARAIPLRRQVERLEGLGDNTRDKLVALLRDAHPTLWAARAPRVNPWEDENVLWCTEAGLRRRTAERDDILNVQMRDNARRIGEAASHGDLSENSEYKFALEERDFLRARLAQVNGELSLARPLALHDVPAEHVGVGSRVHLRPVAGGPERIVTFLGPFETDVDHEVYNYRAPMSQKLMGAAVGDHVRLMRDGQEQEYEITRLESGLSPAPSP
jgi:transcription elongation GreA/GreB family factor